MLVCMAQSVHESPVTLKIPPKMIFKLLIVINNKPYADSPQQKYPAVIFYIAKTSWPSDPYDTDHRLGSNAFASSGKPEFFRSSGFNIHRVLRNAQITCDQFPHRCDERR